MAAATHFTFPPQYDELPIGFRFRPTEDELITHYLEHKMLGHQSLVQYILEIDLYKYEPWELPQRSIFESDNFEWFFFRAHTSKTKRTTGTGCWRTTGDDRPIKARGTNKVIATRKILVFYEGRGANAVKTNWVIHEYHHPHLDTNIPYQHPFVICRLKENAEERDVSTCERNEQNSGVASHLKKKGTQRAIQEMNRDAQANGPSVLQPLWHPTRQPALADVQSVNNAYDGEVNMQPIQRGAFENEVNITEFLDVMFDPAEFLNDEAKLPWCNPEPALMDFQPSDGNDGEVQNQLLQTKASESELNLSEFLFNSLLVEDENWDEETSNDLIDSYNQEELDSMLYELPYVGFSSDTDTDTAFGLPSNHISPSLYQFTRSPGHNMPTIKKSLRSPLTVKRFEHKEEKDIYRVGELQLPGNSSVQGEARICRTSMDSDKSDPGPRTFEVVRHQSKSSSSNVVPYGSEPKRDRLKREIRSKAMSQDKAKEDEKHMEIVDSPQRQLSMTDSNNGLKSEAGNKATPTKSGMSCCGCGYIGSRRNWFSYILTTKRIHHESSLPVVYVAKAILGTVMFVMFAQKVLLYGHWR